MRRLFFLLLILLLPLRGWSGDAMAIHMALPMPVQQAALHVVVGHVDHAQNPSHVHLAAKPVVAPATGDCEGHASADGTNPTDSADCASCSMCQTCHTVAVLGVMAVADHGAAPRALPQRAAPGFTSADGALALKPPTA